MFSPFIFNTVKTKFCVKLCVFSLAYYCVNTPQLICTKIAKRKEEKFNNNLAGHQGLHKGIETSSFLTNSLQKISNRSKWNSKNGNCIKRDLHLFPFLYSV